MRLIAVAILLVFGATRAASAADLAGSWILKAQFASKASYTFICTLKSADPAIEGPCSAIQGRVLSATGSLDGKRLRLKYSTDYNGSGIELEYSGEVQPDGSVKGSASNRLGDGLFTAAPLISDSQVNPQAWRMNVAFQDVNYNLICSLKEDGTRLKGPCGISDGSVLDIRGSSDGDKISLSYDANVQGAAIHADYTGAVQPDGSLRGEIKAGDDTGTFTAKRP